MFTFLSAVHQLNFELIEVKKLIDGEDILQAVRQRINHPSYAYEITTMPEVHAGKTDWDFSIGANKTVLKRLQQQPVLLGDLTRKIFVGIQTSLDSVYVLKIIAEKEKTYVCFSKKLNEEVEIEKGLLKPV